MPTNLNNRTHILFNTPALSTPFPAHGWMLMSRAAYAALRQVIGTAAVTYNSFYDFVDAQYTNPSGDRYTFNNGHLIYLGPTFEARCGRNYRELLCDLVAPYWNMATLPGQSSLARCDPRYYEYRPRRHRQRRRSVSIFSTETQVIIFIPPPPPNARSHS